MTPPRLVACYFGARSGGQWPRLARVLEYSARRHCPDWQVDIHQITPRPLAVPSFSSAYAANTQKLDEWTRIVAAAQDGDRLALLDADTMILHALDSVWDLNFDLAYTRRPASCRLPINAGVIFLRVTARVRSFVERWRDENRLMLRDRQRHETWRKRYGGINQAALGAILEAGAGAQLAVVPLECLEWNCEDASWPLYDPAVTRIVHLKSALRQALFSRAHVSASVRPLAHIWQDLERAAGAGAVRASRDGKVTTPEPEPAPVLRAPLLGPPPGFHRYQSRGGRPKSYPDGSVHLSLRVPIPLYDAYCRKALAARHKSMTRVIQDALKADLVKTP
jgi:hypothetical protein